MGLLMQIAAGIVGFILGFIGWPCAFLLTSSLGRLLAANWNQRLIFSGYVIWIALQLFFLTVMFTLLEFQIMVFLPYSAARKDVVRLVLGSSFFGFFVYGALPMIEAKMRGVPRYRQ